jgi:hypothetical protein
VQVVRYPVKGGEQLPPELGLVELKRRGVWHNGLRNRKVAQLARAFAGGDHAELDRLLPGSRSLVPMVPPRDVLVLVENVEHALALAQRLPDWVLLTGPDLHEDGLTPEQVGRLHTMPDPFRADPLHAVATTAALADMDVAQVDVLVRADGGTNLPPVTDEMLAEPAEGPERPLLLVDMVDRQHPVLRRRSRSRQQAYEERGWFAAGIDTVQARVEHFLANRPGRCRP